jgi:muramoyltetrapeptide carboxypeptidase LdcA involved in peptidoglycan recycling
MKTIRFSQHALDQMRLRGATREEVRETVQTTLWQLAKRGKYQVRKTFAFGRPSPINQQIYPFKTVHVIFADEPDEIVIVTVLVYYGR